MGSRLPWEQDTTGFDSPVPDWSVEDILGVCRFARDFAKVVDQVRFLTRTSVRMDSERLQPTGCDQTPFR